jgi:hypothetical protein
MRPKQASAIPPRNPKRGSIENGPNIADISSGLRPITDDNITTNVSELTKMIVPIIASFFPVGFNAGCFVLSR